MHGVEVVKQGDSNEVWLEKVVAEQVRPSYQKDLGSLRPLLTRRKICVTGVQFRVATTRKAVPGDQKEVPELPARRPSFLDKRQEDPQKRCRRTTFCDPESPFLVFCGSRITQILISGILWIEATRSLTRDISTTNLPIDTKTKHKLCGPKRMK